MLLADYKHQAEVMKALSNVNRVKVVCLLKQRKSAVWKMALKLRIRQANLSQHLMVLKKVGLVTSERQGKEIYYSLANNYWGIVNLLG